MKYCEVLKLVAEATVNCFHASLSILEFTLLFNDEYQEKIHSLDVRSNLYLLFSQFLQLTCYSIIY